MTRRMVVPAHRTRLAGGLFDGLPKAASVPPGDCADRATEAAAEGGGPLLAVSGPVTYHWRRECVCSIMSSLPALLPRLFCPRRPPPAPVDEPFPIVAEAAGH